MSRFANKKTNNFMMNQKVMRKQQDICYDVLPPKLVTVADVIEQPPSIKLPEECIPEPELEPVPEIQPEPEITMEVIYEPTIAPEEEIKQTNPMKKPKSDRFKLLVDEILLNMRKKKLNHNGWNI
jgi:hypothetical protein